MNRVRRLLSGWINRLRGEMGRAFVRTFIARAIAALGALMLALVIGRLHGPSGVGVYALAYGLLLGAGLLSRTGMDNALMRYVGQDYDSPFVLRYLRWAVTRCLVASLAMAGALWFGRFFFESVFESIGLAGVLIGISIAVPAYSLGFLLSGFFKGIRKPATACLLENGSVALLAGGLILAWEGASDSADLARIGYAYAIAAWLVALQGSCQVWCWLQRQPWWHERSQPIWTSDLPVSINQFKATSCAFFMTNLAAFMQQVLGVLVAGWLLNSSELGLFKASQQAAVLIGFILIVINAIFPPRFALLYHQREFVALERLARQGALLGSIFGAPLLLICLIIPDWVLGWFGEGFSSAAPLLRIIALAQLVNVATGSVGFLLAMTGHESLMRNIALICNALGLAAFFLLIPFFGAFGAALALAFVLIVQNLVALLFVWRRLGIWTLPGPNLLAFLGIRSLVDR